MTLGGVVGGMVRCTDPPTVLVQELVPHEDDDECGSMTMCTACFLVFVQQVQPSSEEYCFEELKE
ncbi:MAG: hypothetical protein CMK74_14690 [Pseudomonadales bacterium]|nr:hypothetical protein [Pseudomonadales bacterium]|tara:strand:- start:419 stop:613 length:195 start_codon:yes stop_codon:yes gene_type:complete